MKRRVIRLLMYQISIKVPKSLVEILDEVCQERKRKEKRINRSQIVREFIKKYLESIVRYINRYYPCFYVDGEDYEAAFLKAVFPERAKEIEEIYNERSKILVFHIKKTTYKRIRDLILKINRKYGLNLKVSSIIRFSIIFGIYKKDLYNEIQIEVRGI